MSVRVKSYKGQRGVWHVGVRTPLADGQRPIRWTKIDNCSKTEARHWGEARERHLLRHGLPDKKKEEVPTFAEFAPRFHDHARTNRRKPSTIATNTKIVELYLMPLLGPKRLDAIGNEDIQRLKSHLQHCAPKTVNNVLWVLSAVFRTAVELGVIERKPCDIQTLATVKPRVRFYDFGDYAQLVAAARQEGDPQAELVVLLGGEAGLRRGEITALEWEDVDVNRQQLCVQRSDWNGHVTAPKGGRLRYVPMTRRLAAALQAHRHRRSRRVLCASDGTSLTPKMVTDFVCRAARRGQLVQAGIHILRHTFCSHLAMRGAPVKSIQELAGHQDIATTQRYMHLSPSAIEQAIRLLDASETTAIEATNEQRDQANREVTVQ